MEALPSQSVPSSHSGKGGGGGPQRMIDEEESTVEVEQETRGRAVNEAQPTWIKLGLGIGSNSAAAQNPVTEHGKPVAVELTPAQLHELQGQTLIYKHLEAGLPVPLHLLVPIWKSVACFFGPAIYKLYPSFIGYFSPQGFDYKTMMDPEPGRCRRTDGKKWRCSKNVVPDQKYCERHMHRGRQRSRKPVEAFEISSPSDSMPSDKLEGLNPNHANSATVGLQLMTPSSLSFSNATNSNIRIKKYVSSDTISTRTSVPAMTTMPAATSATRATTLPTFTANSIKRINHVSERKDVSGSPLIYSLTMKSNGNRIISPGLGFSPKSVLQDQGCNRSCFEIRNEIELEPGRCRRTDGKKWRCSRDIVPDRKYCVQHMHRGAKKRVAVTQKVFVPPASSSAAIHRASHSLSTNVPNEAGLSSLNTDLSISIQASSQLLQIDEKSTTSSSSDTTITDTSITANQYGYISS